MSTTTEYDFWDSMIDVVNSTHEELLGQGQVAVIEMNPLLRCFWVQYFDTVNIARSFVAAMSNCCDDDTYSQFSIVGADIQESVGM